MFYISTNILFYLLSYRNNTHFFAGNQKNIRINPNLQYYIIVPCFNEEDVIYHTLQKLLKFNQFQVVVVDDGSTDRSSKKSIIPVAIYLLQMLTLARAMP